MNFKRWILLFVVLFFVLISCNGYKKYSKSDFAMGTDLTITFFSNNGKEAQALLDRCFELAENLEGKVSASNKKSIISGLNKDKVKVITDWFVFNLIVEAVKYAKDTEGAFDPSLFYLTELWGFDKGNKTVPSKADIEASLERSGYHHIVRNKQRIFLDNNIALNLGGIAKGKIIGEIGALLEANGINDYLINGGGDIVVKGLHEGKRPWKIAIADPFTPGSFTGIIELTDAAIVTSGDYERYFTTEDGTMYHHILDPATGYPINNGLHSVTVVTTSPSMADAYATALFVMGKEKGLEVTEKTEGLDVIMISGSKEDKQIVTSKNLHFKKHEKFDYYFELK